MALVLTSFWIVSVGGISASVFLSHVSGSAGSTVEWADVGSVAMVTAMAQLDFIIPLRGEWDLPVLASFI